MSKQPEADRLVAIYEAGGQSAIYDYVLSNHPDWKWELCDPCDDKTPTWEDVCAVCFTLRQPPAH